MPAGLGERLKGCADHEAEGSSFRAVTRRIGKCMTSPKPSSNGLQDQLGRDFRFLLLYPMSGALYEMNAAQRFA